MRAKGVVSGQTERRAIATCALQEKWLQLTGKKDKYTVLLWQEHQLFAFGAKESPYLYSTNRVAYKNLFRWGNLQSPLCLKTVTYEEKILLQRSYTSSDAYQVAVERARRQLQTQLPQTATFVRESSGVHRTTEDGMIQAEVVWIVEEPIGQLQQVELPGEATVEMLEKK